MTLKNKLVDWIIQEEGYVKSDSGTHEVYKDSAGYPTIGYGHKLLPHEKFTSISEEEARQLLYNDIKKHSQVLDEDIANGLKVTDDQYIALTSLAFNIGTNGYKNSSVRSKLLAGDTAGAADAFKMWNKAGGEPGVLSARRGREVELFNAGATVDPTYKDVAPPSVTSEVTGYQDLFRNNPTTTEEFTRDNVHELFIDAFRPVQVVPQADGSLVTEVDPGFLESFQKTPVDPTFLESKQPNVLQEIGQEASMLDAFKGGLRSENFADDLVLQKLMLDSQPYTDVDLNLDVEATLSKDPILGRLKGTEYEQSFNSFFAKSKNKEDLENRMWLAKRQIISRANQMYSEHGIASMIGSMLGGVLNPTTLFIGPRIKLNSYGTAAATGAGATSAFALADEFFLHMVDPTRTLEESAINGGFAAILGAGAGLGLKKLATPEFLDLWIKKQAAKGNKVVFNDLGQVEDVITPKGLSAGVPELDDLTAAETGLFNIPGMKQMMKKTSPAAKVMFSKSKVNSKVFNSLFQTEIVSKSELKNLNLKPGIAWDVAVKTRTDNAIFALDDALDVGAKSAKMARAEFQKLVNEANMDLSFGIKKLDEIDNVHVRSAVEKVQKLVQEVGDEHVRLGNIAKIDESNRFYHKFRLDREKVLYAGKQFVDDTRVGVRAKVAELLRKDGIPDNVISKVQNRIEDGLDIKVADLRTELEGSPYRGRISKTASGLQKKKGSFSFEHAGKEYDLSFSDIPELRKYWSDDLQDNLQSYLSKNYKDIEFQKRFPEGFKTIEDMIRAEDNQAMATMSKSEYAKFKTETSENFKLIKELLDIGMGNKRYDEVSSEIAAIAKGLVSPAALGQVAFTMTSDVPHTILAARFGRVSGPHVSHLRNAINSIDSLTAKKMVLGVEEVLDDFQIGKLDINEFQPPKNAVGRGLRFLQKFTYKAFGMGKIDKVLRWAVGKSTVNGVVESLLDLDTGAKWADPAFDYIRQLGINEKLARDMLAEIKRVGTLTDGKLDINIDAWNSDMGLLLKSTIRRNADRLVVRGSQADAPLWTQNPWGAIVTQYWNYLFGYNSKILIPAMQRAGQIGSTTIMMSIIGARAGIMAMNDMIKDKAKGKELRPAEDYMKDAFIKVQGLGVFGEMASRMWASTGGEYKRFQRMTDTIPILSYTNRVETVAEKALDKDFDKQFWRNLRGVMPFGNFFPIDVFFRQLEIDERLGKKFGKPDQRKTKKQTKARR